MVARPGEGVAVLRQVHFQRREFVPFVDPVIRLRLVKRQVQPARGGLFAFPPEQGQGVGAQQGVLSPAALGGLGQQGAVAQHVQEFGGGVRLVVPQRGGGLCAEVGFRRGERAQKAEAPLVIRAHLRAHVVVAELEGGFHRALAVGLIQRRQVAEAFPGLHAGQQVGDGFFAPGAVAAPLHVPGGDAQRLDVVAQPFGQPFQQVGGQVVKVLPQQGQRVVRRQHVQGLQSELLGDARVARGDEQTGVGGQGAAQRFDGGGGPHVVQHGQQRPVSAQQRAHGFRLQLQAVLPQRLGDELRVAPVGIARPTLQYGLALIAAAEGVAQVGPQHAAGVRRAVRVDEHRGQGALAHARHPRDGSGDRGAGIVGQAGPQRVQVRAPPDRVLPAVERVLFGGARPRALDGDQVQVLHADLGDVLPTGRCLVNVKGHNAAPWQDARRMIGNGFNSITRCASFRRRRLKSSATDEQSTEVDCLPRPRSAARSASADFADLAGGGIPGDRPDAAVFETCTLSQHCSIQPVAALPHCFRLRLAASPPGGCDALSRVRQGIHSLTTGVKSTEVDAEVSTLDPFSVRFSGLFLRSRGLQSPAFRRREREEFITRARRSSPRAWPRRG